MLTRKWVTGILALLLLLASLALAEEGPSAPEIRVSGIPINEARFPDAAFRAYVQQQCDGNHDGMLTKAERMAVQEMNVSGLGIVSLDGIECFNQLRVLRCENNALAALDVSRNFELRELYCGGVEGGGLSTLDVSRNPELTTLNCCQNQLSALDLSRNTRLQSLDCSQNALTTLDLRKNRRLHWLKCDGNNIAALDITSNGQLIPFIRDRMPFSGGTGIVNFTEDGQADSAVVVCLPSCCFVSAEGQTLFGLGASMIVGDGNAIDIGYTERFNLLSEALRPFAQEFTYQSSKPSVATVDANGVVTGVKVGNANITVTGKDGVSAVQRIVVKWGSDYVRLTSSSATLGVGERFEFDAYLMDDETASGALYVNNNDPTVCSVAWTNKHFTIEALQPGTATLTISTYNKKTTEFQATVVPAPEGVAFPESTLTMGVSQTYTLAPVFSPEGASSQNRAYQSSDTSVVTVDSAGTLTARGQGQASITLETYNHLTATANVTVLAAPASVSLNAATRKLGVDETFQLVPAIPEGSASSFAYSSDARSVATVSQTGLITAKKEGTARITVRTHNNKTATCTVTVKKKPTSISLEDASVVLGVGQVYSPRGSLSSGSASALTWQSSNTDVVREVEGRLTAVGIGECVLTVSTYNGLTASCDVTVKAAPDAIALSDTTLTISEYMTWQLTPTITATGYDECMDAHTFVSSDNTVVSVSETGLLKGLKRGTATITVQTWNELTATCSVEVVDYHSLHPTEIIAHRGVSGHFPENTLAAFQAAPEYGAYGVELDVRTTKDGLQVINHNETIKVNGREYRLLDYTYAQLKNLKPDMCTLEEALEVIKEAGLELHMELKDTANAAKCVELVESHGMKERTIYFTFSADLLRQLYAADPHAVLGQSINEKLSTSEFRRRMNDLHLTFVALNYKKTTQADMNACHNMGLKVCIWTVNDAENIRKFSEMGADYIITNYPDLAQ